MIEDFLTYLSSEKRYSELTVRAYGDDIRQFVLFCNGLSEAVKETFEHASTRCVVPLRPRPAGGVQGRQPQTKPFVAAATEEQVQTVLRSFDPSLVDGNDLRAWIMHLTGEEHLSARSVNRKISSIKSYFRFLRKKGVIHKDPFLRITALKMPRRLPSFVEESRMQQILNSIVHPSDDWLVERDALIVLLFYATGIRLAELVDIQIDDFSDHFSLLKVHGKGDKDRVVPVIEAVSAKIVHYLELCRGLEICESGINFLFLSQRGRRISRSEVYRVVHTILRGAGVQGKSSPHVLRHTFATHLLNSGADIRMIQELLGHTSLGATQVYTHNSIEQLKQVYNKAHPRADNIKK